jgi:hypothetical protein
MKKADKNKRYFLKSSSLFLISLYTLKNFKFTFVNNIKNNIFKFVKKNKKIWILSKNDFN